MPPPRGRAVVVDHRHGAGGHVLRQLLRVVNRRRAADERGMRAVERADALQPPEHVCEVRAEHAAVGVNLVNDHIFQVFKQPHPLGVMRKNALMQHVRVRHHHMPRLPDRRARGRGRVAVIGERLDVRAQRLHHRIQLRHLIAGKRLRRKQIQRACGVVLQNRVQHRQVISTAFFPDARRRDDDEVAPA